PPPAPTPPSAAEEKSPVLGDPKERRSGVGRSGEEPVLTPGPSPVGPPSTGMAAGRSTGEGSPGLLNQRLPSPAARPVLSSTPGRLAGEGPGVKTGSSSLTPNA